VHESSANQVAGEPVFILDAALANPSGGEPFQFPERERGGFLVSLVTGSVNEIVIFSNYPWAVPAFLFRPSNQAK